MHLNLKAAISLLLVIATISCQKISATDKGIHDFRYTNEQLLYELESRHQIGSVSHKSKVISVIFSDNTELSFPEEIYPSLVVGANDCWSINDHQTNIPVQYDYDNQIVLPELSAGENGVWSIDGESTSISDSLYVACLKDTKLYKILSGIVVQQGKLSFIFSDNSSYPVVLIKEWKHLVPSYYLEHLVEKEKMAEQAIADSKGNNVSFVFFTDAHWDNNYKHSPSLIKHITDYTGINKVFFGGDVIYLNSSTPQKALEQGLDFQKSFSFLGPNFYCVYGNHDNNSDGQIKKPERHLTEEQVISYLQSQMTKLDNKSGYNFYFDDIKSRTRFIGLDTGRYAHAEFRSTAIDTANYLIEALTGVPDDWHIIVVSHIFMGITKKDGINQGFFESFYNFPLTIMDNYNQRKAGKFTYRERSTSYDFSACKGHVEICVGGHIHGECLLFTKGGIPVIAVPTDSRSLLNKGDVSMGTINEQSVSILVADYESNKVQLFTVGRGVDRVIDLQ